jgi:uncharacterized protein (DUF2236 family)
VSDTGNSDHDEQRLFSPHTMIWRVDREMVLLLAGGRALLMQLAHPKVAAGVADHSSFTDDPLGRLHRTMNTMWSIVFDDAPDAYASLERVNEIHRKVRGAIKHGEPLPKGMPYDALDAGLLLWVHATLVDSAIVAYDLFVRRLSLNDRAAYYEDTKKLAYLFGIPRANVPPSLQGFDDYMQRMLDGNAVAVGPTARTLAREILHPRPWILRMGGPLFSFMTVGLLPQRLRAAYGLTWSKRRERIFQALAKSIRTFLPLVPAPLRIVRHARAAEKKLARRS